MIQGIFHRGSGIGNQLHRYIFTRVKALDLGVPFGMKGEWKGADFMPLDIGAQQDVANYFLEERINNEKGIDIRPYDIKSELITANTLVDGEFQDETYWKHRENEVREWLKVEPIEIPDNVCVINFRGGEYIGVKDLFLPKEYWETAIQEMLKINKDMQFVVHTDDPVDARIFFPDYNTVSSPSLNWRSIRYAKYIILSNSSFGILPAWLNDKAEKIIAPMFWAGRNVGYWKMAQNQYSKFTYL